MTITTAPRPVDPGTNAGAPHEAASGVARSDARATNSAEARALYVARVPIYPKAVHGRFRTLKWIGLAVMLGIYYLLPWVRWDRGPNAPDQAVLADFTHERFYFFWIEIWPQVVYYITGLLILASFLLFFVTALFGRVWCGYACPQTVWTDLFIAVERLFEGDRSARIRLARQPWSANKLARVGGKHAAWLVIAAATGGAWVLYFHDAPTVVVNLFQGTAPLSAYVFLGVLTFTTYALAGLMREQVCTYMCPWPRIQAALTDEEALSVTYRRDRGEPRGPHRKAEPWEGRGDCIDCNQCVAACPMGIDIRDGAQLECINCALCIDACDDVMTRIGRPRGLIAYDNDRNMERRAAGQPARYRLVRPRTVLYAVLMVAVAGVMAFGLGTRASVEATVQRDRNPAFVALADGSVRNAYTLKILNRTGAPRTLALSVTAPEGAELRLIGTEVDGLRALLPVGADRQRPVRALITLPAAALTAASLPVVFTVTEPDTGETAAVASVFLSPERTDAR